MKKAKKENALEKKLNKISNNFDKIKKESLELWVQVKKFNLKNDNRLRPFENELLSKLITDLRIIQSDHITRLKVLIKDANV